MTRALVTKFRTGDIDALATCKPHGKWVFHTLPAGAE
jgi:hypothetical protein